MPMLEKQRSAFKDPWGSCPLCGTGGPFDGVAGSDRREYLHCRSCDLIFVSSDHHLDPQAERARYEMHENSVEDAGYCRFLGRLLNPMLNFLAPGMRGLDYGCGPGPTLSELARREGVICEDYDPIFFDRELDPPYDFIFATECLEHFFHPRREIERIVDLLKPGGFLGVMTDVWKSVDAFRDWHYSRDDTHVCFYSLESMTFIEERYMIERVWSDDERAFVFRKVRAVI